MNLRDARKDPKLNDRFLTPKGNIITIVGIGTENYRQFATLRKHESAANIAARIHGNQRRSGKPRKGAPKGHHAAPGVQVWWDELLVILQSYTHVAVVDLKDMT
jgi:hypothetical protein